MFKIISEAFKKTEKIDALTAATSQASQENTVASSRLKDVLSRYVDSDDCAPLTFIKGR